ncbi:uncharacterized protein ASPGLDRAFT_138617 [Aspergillus glaucus CBS 516.65]|uniref:Uncharacterized protein n=1 Tax=Aspergillus glaucus CBS 516.65 TaxID=1160497 RepID=A0A1L9V3R7_ASPGL|nr:hypothetical protein ASPGLDRAFT_138617 [Aspergillus glaucus CBS 516.65]OJJ78568.1 hypothetical protein ASPGLDRAFT_138617 [Aspergillus glaucus CBS 516.65]
MANPQSLRDAAASVADNLRLKIRHRSHPHYPWLFLPRDKEEINTILNLWLQEGSLDAVTQKTGKSFKENPRENISDAYPILWADRPLATGVLQTPFPGKTLVIIALEDLDDQNGLPTNITKISCGSFAVHSGDEDLKFKKQGGGLAFFVLLD